MKRNSWFWLGLGVTAIVSFGIAGCANLSHADEEEGEHQRAEDSEEHAAAEEGGEHAMSEGEREHGETREGSGEHSGEHGEAGHDDEGEESGVYIGIAETWDAPRSGARLVLSFDADAGAFVGTVENTTTRRICAVRVEVHLSNGTELGPTPRTDLAAGQLTEVRLPTERGAFESWTAHPEVSACSGV